jgi:phosphopantothenate---cysteine ligase (CTP)
MIFKGCERLNLIITAGGTRERIDAVRSITNGATGRLGRLIAEEFSARLAAREHTIYYLCGAGSVIPAVEDPAIRIIQIEGTDQLQSEMENLLTTQHIDAVIHSMAVSDYKVSCITTPEQIAENVARSASAFSGPHSREQWQEMIQEALAKGSMDGEKKISSELEHPVLMLEKTQKIIGMIKKISPQTVLVGFKLLSGVSEETLIDTAYQLLLKNKCDFVLANDMDSIKDGNHVGYLIDSCANFVKFLGKEAIAKGIADSLLKKLLEGIQ